MIIIISIITPPGWRCVRNDSPAVDSSINQWSSSINLKKWVFMSLLNFSVFSSCRRLKGKSFHTIGAWYVNILRVIFVSRVFGRSRSRLSEADLRDFLHGSSWYNLIKSRKYGGAVPLRTLWTRRHILYLTRNYH